MIQTQSISELLTRVLAGSWREALPALEITAEELAAVTPALLQTRGVLGQGGTDDASTRLQLIPSEGIAVIVLANTGTILPEAVVNEPSISEVLSFIQNLSIQPDAL